MCGISGGVFLHSVNAEAAQSSVRSLHRRGPDHQAVQFYDNWFLGHARLSILDLSENGHQPMRSSCGNFSLVFNGEIYNYKALRAELIRLGYSFQSDGDTEVLLNGLKHWGMEILPRLNGFFAFAYFDHVQQICWLARDRMGIKPLWLCSHSGGHFFASEHKALYPMGMGRELNPTAVRCYFRMGYIPGPISVFKNGQQLMPGHWVKLSKSGFEEPKAWWSLPVGMDSEIAPIPSYQTAVQRVRALVEEAVADRLISDVPLGSFLSGGVDSSVVVAVASQRVKGLHTFSIGFKDQPYFDETRYAEQVANRFGTEHTTFSLSNDDLLNQLPGMLAQMDMPFADSSALPVYMLCQETKKHVTVALSGDGGDELFSGYHKHAGEWAVRNDWKKKLLAEVLSPFIKPFAGGRGSAIENKIRQLNKFREGSRLDAFERYRRWAGVVGDRWVEELVLNPGTLDQEKSLLMPLVDGAGILSTDFNGVLAADLQLVLPFDMLTKVDLMSMANSLEVRVPLLDYRLINYVHALPSSYKIDGQRKKKLLIDAFRAELPVEVWQRRKQGFEVPLMPWFRKELKGLLNETLNLEKIKAQKVLNPLAVNMQLNRLNSKNPGELPFILWSLFVWQTWYDKTLIEE